MLSAGACQGYGRLGDRLKFYHHNNIVFHV